MNKSKHFVSSLYQHPETDLHLEIVSNQTEMIDKWSSIFIQSDKIVGAQFYYTNPILYMLMKSADTQNSACLYDNIYLMNVDKTDVNSSNFLRVASAVNHNFLEKIGSYFDRFDQITANLIEMYHHEYGLYLVGIDVGDQDGTS